MRGERKREHKFSGEYVRVEASTGTVASEVLGIKQRTTR